MDKLQVAKFNGKTDFPVWKVQVRAYLEANSWFGTIDGSTVTTQAWGAANPEWQKTEAKAKAVILNSVETSVVRTIMNLKTAKEMWTRLSTLYESHSKLSVSLLRQEFYSYRMTESMDMATHIANVESMVQRLNDVDKAVSEDEIVTKLLQLPKKYHHLVTAWD